MRTAYNHLAHFIDTRDGAVVASNLHPHSFNAATDWNNRACQNRASMIDDVLRDDAGLGRGELIDKDTVLESMVAE